ncbi:MAG: 50S ribosomal protein L15 [Patescibacteria group bacterium]
MQFHSLQRENKNKRSIRVGRGGKRGKTSGRGTKGQKARAGRKLRPELRDIIKRIPKLRGRGKHSEKSLVPRFVPVNLKALETKFDGGTLVSPTTLAQKGIVRLIGGKYPKVKILGTGTLTKKLNFEKVSFSASAKEAVEKAGGKIAPEE